MHEKNSYRTQYAKDKICLKHSEQNKTYNNNNNNNNIKLDILNTVLISNKTEFQTAGLEYISHTFLEI